jgi:hypothetical protein
MRIILKWILKKYVGFEVLTEVVMKSTVFWYITPCSPLKVNRNFGGTYHHHLQGRRISGAISQHESRWLSRTYVPPKRRLTFNGLHSVIVQKIELFLKKFLSSLANSSFWRGTWPHEVSSDPSGITPRLRNKDKLINSLHTYFRL